MSLRATSIALGFVALFATGCIEAEREPARAPSAQPSTPPPNPAIPPMPPLQQRQNLRQPRGGVADDSV